MRQIHAEVLLIHSQPRERIYRVLASQPQQTWTFRSLGVAVPGVSIEAVKATVYMMLGDHLVKPLPRTRSLTFQLTDDGQAMITEVHRRWAPITAMDRSTS